MFKTLTITLAALLSGGSAALAHVTFEAEEAKAGANYKAVLRVPHGCEGKATTTIRVQVPEGAIAAKPMPKPGWKLETVKGKYDKSYELYGTPVSEGVKEIVWSGGELPDDFYDEFVFRVMLTEGLATAQTVYFPVVQECGDVAERWIEIPAAGQDPEKLEYPAPGVRLITK